MTRGLPSLQSPRLACALERADAYSIVRSGGQSHQAIRRCSWRKPNDDGVTPISIHNVALHDLKSVQMILPAAQLSSLHHERGARRRRWHAVGAGRARRRWSEPELARERLRTPEPRRLAADDQPRLVSGPSARSPALPDPQAQWHHVLTLIRVGLARKDDREEDEHPDGCSLPRIHGVRAAARRRTPRPVLGARSRRHRVRPPVTRWRGLTWSGANST